MTTIILTIYIILLLVGGLFGFLKAGSKVSLITSLIFGVALAACVWGPVPNGLRIAEALQGLLVIVFAIRLAKTRKFMPSGMMLAVTVVAIILELATASH